MMESDDDNDAFVAPSIEFATAAEPDTSESRNSEGYDRYDYSESGIVTEMEHNRSQSMNAMEAVTKALGHVHSTVAYDDSVTALPTSSSTGGGFQKKSSKHRRLSSRVAKGVKKQLKIGSSSKDKDKHKHQQQQQQRPRSLSPPRTRTGSGGSQDQGNGNGNGNNSPSSSGDEGDLQLSPGAGRQSQSERPSNAADGERKKKHKSKYKQVAKAAAAAAKKIDKTTNKITHKITGKKSSSSKNKDRNSGSAGEQQRQLRISKSMDAADPTSSPHIQFHVGAHMAAINNNTTATAIGTTPVNTPVNATTLIDGRLISPHMLPLPELSSTLSGVDEAFDEEEESGHSGSHTSAIVIDEEPSIRMEEDPLQPTKFAPFAESTPTSHHQRNPTEDETLKLASAMALAVQNNPTMSHQDIQRMVLAQPEFQHLAPPEGLEAPATGTTNTTTTSSSGFSKNFKSLQSKLASGAKTAQKGLMEYAGSLESALGNSTTSFPFSMTTTKAANPSDVMKSVKESATAAEATSDVNVVITSGPPGSSPVTIPPETSSLEQSHSTVNSLQSSNASLLPPPVQQLIDPQKQPTAEEMGNSSSKGSLPSVYETTTFVANKAELPITMTDIVWKRRSGFGSYYRSSAWERRRLVLRGNALSYFRAKGERDEKGTGTSVDTMDDGTERFENDPVVIQAATTGGSGKPASTKKRMMDALDSLGLSTAIAATEEKPSTEGKSSARGYMDLIKENATVCATLGHSGAPSPFCLSIKVGGETKWKLCFASHRAQLMWLAAITDVIVENSVDVYNLKLLSAADPSNHDPTAAFLPSVYEPPSNAEDCCTPQQQKQNQQDDSHLPTPNFCHTSGRRLWIMEPYAIKAQSELPPNNGDDSEDEYSDDDDEEEDDEEVGTPVKEQPESDATVNDSDVWFMPEYRLVMAAVLINMAIMYARNSTMSVQSFWTLVTVANMVLFAFLESMPRPGVVVTTDSTQASSPAVKVRRKLKRRCRSKRTGLGSNVGPMGSADGGKPKKKKEKYIPEAGLSAIKLNNHLDPKTNSKGEEFMAWMAVPGEDLLVRSHGYLTTKAKVPSPGSLYELVQMDIFESPARFPDMAPRVKLPALSYGIDPNEVKTWKAPDHFIVSLALPTDPPKLGASSSDGSGYTVTMYFNMNKATRDILKHVTAEGYDPASEPPPADNQKSQVNAVRLFEDWIRRAPNDIEYQKRFKMIPNVVNAKEVGLPSWIGKYNGKPFLIKRPGQTGFLLPHPELSCVEFDISLHVFPYLAKQGICYMKDTMFKKILARVGFCIEGQSDDELPECVIGLGQVCYPDPDVCMQASGFFAGTAPRSYEPEDTAEQPPAYPSEPKPPQPAGAPPKPVGK